MSAEQVEREEGEEEHVGGGEDDVQHGGDITQQRNRIILSEVQRSEGRVEYVRKLKKYLIVELIYYFTSFGKVE